MGVAAVSTPLPLVAGLGLRATARADHLQALWQQACDWLVQQPDWPAGQVPTVATLAVLAHKADHPALQAWRAQLPWATRLLALPPAQLAGQPVPTQSARLLARYGTGSVAEAAALAAAGPHSALSVTRLVADDGSATLALAVGQGGPLNCCLAHASQAKNQGATA